MGTSSFLDRADKSVLFFEFFDGCGGLAERFIQLGSTVHVEMNNVMCPLNEMGDM